MAVSIVIGAWPATSFAVSAARRCSVGTSGTTSLSRPSASASGASISRAVKIRSLVRAGPTSATTRLIEAPEALSLGLLNEIVPDVPTLQRRADETAKLVAGHAPITMETAKEAVLRLRRTLSREEGRDLILRAYMSEDFREGMDAFLNKRTPNWKGK